jgi:hypothetical protein
MPSDTSGAGPSQASPSVNALPVVCDSDGTALSKIMAVCQRSIDIRAGRYPSTVPACAECCSNDVSPDRRRRTFLPTCEDCTKDLNQGREGQHRIAMRLAGHMEQQVVGYIAKFDGLDVPPPNSGLHGMR